MGNGLLLENNNALRTPVGEGGSIPIHYLAESCAVIGYPSGQDGALLLGGDYLLCPARK